MSRPRIPIDTFGEMTFVTPTNGTVRARARFRDWDGKSRLVQATGATKAAAQRVLKVKLNERTLFQPAGTTLAPDSTFDHLVDYLAVRLWETGIVPTGPKPDGQLSVIIEVMLGTSARIGEALAIRRRAGHRDGGKPRAAARWGSSSLFLVGSVRTIPWWDSSDASGSYISRFLREP